MKHAPESESRDGGGVFIPSLSAADNPLPSLYRGFLLSNPALGSEELLAAVAGETGLPPFHPRAGDVGNDDVDDNLGRSCCCCSWGEDCIGDCVMLAEVGSMSIIRGD